MVDKYLFLDWLCKTKTILVTQKVVCTSLITYCICLRFNPHRNTVHSASKMSGIKINAECQKLIDFLEQNPADLTKDGVEYCRQNHNANHQKASGFEMNFDGERSDIHIPSPAWKSKNYFSLRILKYLRVYILKYLTILCTYLELYSEVSVL